mgnify:FL=1
MEIQDFNDYLIYPDGRVFSKKSNIFLKSGDVHGYRAVGIWNNEGKKQLYVHRLVAIHYIPNPENKPEVDHANRIRDDNRVENLRWATISENEFNKGILRSNKSGFKWISHTSKSMRFSRKNCKVKVSQSLPKLLCYSFFYLLKK